tara:strand:- start:160 stop:786 length:627 start_codon:yes stop_codon:yes gene_type:complete
MTRVIIKAGDPKALAPFRHEKINLDTMRALAKTSLSENGPAEAQDFLYRLGIPLVIEPHLPKTYLDGAAILLIAERPIIALSLRHDRLDNFWFTLMHEVAHVVLHSNIGCIDFIDDLDVATSDDPREREADDLAREALIPSDAWEKSPASNLRSPQAAQHLARQLSIHPAIVAGRMRHHWKDFRLLKNYVGHRDVRRNFSYVDWADSK